MRVKVKGRFCTTEHVWFENVNEIPRNTKSDVLIIHANNSIIDEELSSKQLSLISDLSSSLDELQISKTVKNEINRSQRDGVSARMFDSFECSSNDIIMDQFKKTYHEMYESKDIQGRWLNDKEISSYINSNAFLLTVAYIDDEPSVFHSYVFDSFNARLLHSCSAFRTTEKEFRNAIGRANKYLHWQDFMFLKSKGIIKYDWGGIASIDNPNGIDKFKLAFGGTPVEYYNITKNNTLRSKMVKMLKNLRSKYKK